MTSFNFQAIIDKVLQVADMVDDYVPMASTVTAGANIAKSVLGVIDTLSQHATTDQQPALQARRAKLAARVTQKSMDTSARLRGEAIDEAAQLHATDLSGKPTPGLSDKR